MHGFFDLKDQVAESEFAASYEKFAAYLVERNQIIGYRAMRRRPNENYDSSPPTTKYYVSMDFEDMAQAESCWDFIENHQEANAKLHRTVYAKIKAYSFFLSEDL